MSSTISLLEVVTALFVDRFQWKRLTATTVSALGVYGLSILSALSLGANKTLSELKLFGNEATGFLQVLNERVTGDKAGVLAILDHVSANWLLPLGGLLITLFVGWALPKQVTHEELFPGEKTPPMLYGAWLFFVRFVAPGAIGWIIIRVIFFGDDFS